MKPYPLPLYLGISLALTIGAQSATFTLSSNSNTARTLNAAETGTINSGVSLTVSGGTTAVTLGATGGTTTINNSGTISQTGDGRAIRNNSSGTPTFNITNQATGTIRADDGDVIRGDVAGSNWTITNSGIIRSQNDSAAGSQAIDLDAVTTGSVNITNNTSGQILATEADAIRAGKNAVIINNGTISATPDNAGSSSDGIDTQTRTGNQITNSGIITGRHGITGGETESVYHLGVTNNNGGVIAGINGAGINTDGALSITNTATITNASGATIKGGLLASTADGDGDGVDVDGVIDLNNSGDILGLGSKGGDGSNAEAVSIGGGTIINTSSGRIVGSSLAADAPNGDSTRDGNGILVDNSDGGNAIAAANITNSGLIQGKSGFGIKITGTLADTVTNNTGGIIRGTNHSATSPVIQTDGGNDVINNAGTIAHDLGNAQTAISAGAGNDIVNITGGNAIVTGGIDGGSNTDTLNFNLGTSTNTFNYAGSISNFESVNALTGKTTLTGSSTYAGTTLIGGQATAARLEQNGTHSGGGNITVQSNGTFGGTGSETLATGSQITVDIGGILAPGKETETGRLTLGGQGNAIVNGTAAFTLDGTAAGIAGGYDQFRMTGSLTLGALSTLEIDANFTAVLGTVFVLFDLTDPSATVTGQFDGLAEGAEFLADNGNRFIISYQGGTGNDVILTSVIPEPTTYTLLSLGVFAVALRRRRKN